MSLCHFNHVKNIWFSLEIKLRKYLVYSLSTLLGGYFSNQFWSSNQLSSLSLIECESSSMGITIFTPPSEEMKCVALYSYIKRIMKSSFLSLCLFLYLSNLFKAFTVQSVKTNPLCPFAMKITIQRKSYAAIRFYFTCFIFYASIKKKY